MSTFRLAIWGLLHSMPTIMMVQNAKQYDWSTWLMGIMRSLVQGGAAAVVGAFGTMTIAPNTFNLSSGLGKTAELMTVMFIFQGIIHMMMFLQTHGTPDPINVTVNENITNVNPPRPAGVSRASDPTPPSAPAASGPTKPFNIIR